MNPTQHAECLKTLRGLIATVTIEQAAEVGRMIHDLDATKCDAAIRQYAERAEWFNLAAFREVLTATAGYSPNRGELDRQAEERRQRAEEARQIASGADRGFAAFRRQFAGYSTEDQETLVRQAREWSGVKASQFAGQTVHDSKGLCAIVQAYHDQILREAQR